MSNMKPVALVLIAFVAGLVAVLGAGCGDSGRCCDLCSCSGVAIQNLSDASDGASSSSAVDTGTGEQ